MNTNITRRKDKGLPGNGGEFTTPDRFADDSVGLGISTQPEQPDEVSTDKLLEFLDDYDLSHGNAEAETDWITIEGYGHSTIQVDIRDCETMADVRDHVADRVSQFDANEEFADLWPVEGFSASNFLETLQNDQSHFHGVANQIHRENRIKDANDRAAERQARDIAEGLGADLDLDLYVVDRGGFLPEDKEFQQMRDPKPPHLNGAHVQFDDGSEGRIRVYERNGRERAEFTTVDGEHLPYYGRAGEKSYRITQFDGDPIRLHEELAGTYYRDKVFQDRVRLDEAEQKLKEVALAGFSQDKDLHVRTAQNFFGKGQDNVVKNCVLITGRNADGTKPFRVEISEDGDVKEGLGLVKGKPWNEKSELEKRVLRNFEKDRGRIINEAIQAQKNFDYSVGELRISEQGLEEQFGKRD